MVLADVVGTIDALISVIEGAVRKYESVKSFEPECRSYRSMLLALLDVLRDIDQQFRSGTIQGNTSLKRPLKLIRDAVDTGIGVLDKCSKKKRLMVLLFSQEYIGKLRKSKMAIMEALALLPASGISLQASIQQDIQGLEQSIQALDAHLSSCQHNVANMFKSEFERGGEDIADRIIKALTAKGIVTDKDDFHQQLEKLEQEKILFRASKSVYDKDLIDKVIALSLEEQPQNQQPGSLTADSVRVSTTSAAFSDMLNCGIMGILMEDPVILVENGTAYDRKNLCRWLLENPTKDPIGKEYDEPLSYCDAVAIRKCLMEEHGDGAYVPFNDASFKQEYRKVWQEQNQEEEIMGVSGLNDVEAGIVESSQNVEQETPPQQKSNGTTRVGSRRKLLVLCLVMIVVVVAITLGVLQGKGAPTAPTDSLETSTIQPTALMTPTAQPSSKPSATQISGQISGPPATPLPTPVLTTRNPTQPPSREPIKIPTLPPSRKPTQPPSREPIKIPTLPPSRKPTQSLIPTTPACENCWVCHNNVCISPKDTQSPTQQPNAGSITPSTSLQNDFGQIVGLDNMISPASMPALIPSLLLQEKEPADNNRGKRLSRRDL